jgi:crossover junction endodeoxyribonuclease RusA
VQRLISSRRTTSARSNTPCVRSHYTAAVSIGLCFVLPRPTNTPKRRTPPAAKRPDLDKLTRSALDAITGVVLLDNAQVVDLHAHKRLAGLGETPGVTVTIEETEKGNTQ